MIQFIEQLKQEAAPIIDCIYEDPFIQGLLTLNIEKESIVHYLNADSKFLSELAAVYSFLLSKAPTEMKKQFLKDQLKIILAGEEEAHHVLRNFAIQTPYDKKNLFYPAVDYYLKHIYLAVQDHISYAIAAMLPCAYVYRNISVRALESYNWPKDHPLKPWFEFYSSGFEEPITFMETWIEETAANSNIAVKHKLENYFLQSVFLERNFFQKAWVKETWHYGLTYHYSLPALDTQLSGSHTPQG
ncbi:MAG: hypothetical protein WDW20_00520 [Neisseriaceae bacterium]